MDYVIEPLLHQREVSLVENDLGLSQLVLQNEEHSCYYKEINQTRVRQFEVVMQQNSLHHILLEQFEK